MTKFNLTVIATIIATFAIAMFAFQPTTTEASNNVSPSPMPTPRKIKGTTKGVLVNNENVVEVSKQPRKIKKSVPNPTVTTSPIVANKANGWSWGETNTGKHRKQPKRGKN